MTRNANPQGRGRRFTTLDALFEDLDIWPMPAVLRSDLFRE